MESVWHDPRVKMHRSTGVGSKDLKRFSVGYNIKLVVVLT